jgi:hypothetical protein
VNARETTYHPEATVQTTHGVSSTEYRITGELGAVFREITEIFQAYPAMAYGTRVHAIETDYTRGNAYTARMSRSNSCD